jgi:CRP/FNR family transcriptional regulator
MITDLPVTHRRLRQGEHLFRMGSEFHSLYVLNAGFAKTCRISDEGHERTMGYHLRGDILGFEAVASGTYGCNAIALDLCDVLAIPYDAVIAHAQGNPDLMHELHRAFSSEIRGDRDLMISMGGLTAEGRVATFLLETSRQFSSHGFSATELKLRLTRQEIGSLLGMTLETVSRALSHFVLLKLIAVHLRKCVPLDRDGLTNIITRCAR